MAAIAIRSTSEGPVFFAQERYGYRRRKFRMYKFRSMVANASGVDGRSWKIRTKQWDRFSKSGATRGLPVWASSCALLRLMNCRNCGMF